MEETYGIERVDNTVRIKNSKGCCNRRRSV